jgi:hypothetical protein
LGAIVKQVLYLACRCLLRHTTGSPAKSQFSLDEIYRAMGQLHKKRSSIVDTVDYILNVIRRQSGGDIADRVRIDKTIRLALCEVDPGCPVYELWQGTQIHSVMTDLITNSLYIHYASHLGKA